MDAMGVRVSERAAGQDGSTASPAQEESGAKS